MNATAKPIRFIEDQIALMEARGWDVKVTREENKIFAMGRGRWYDGTIILSAYRSSVTNRWNLMPASMIAVLFCKDKQAVTYRDQRIMVDVYATDYVALDARTEAKM